MQKEKVKIWRRSLIVAVSCFVITAVLYVLGVFNSIENKTYDNRMLVTSEKAPRSDDIIFIVVDQESITWGQEEMGWGWPWPRSAYADLIDFVSAGNAKSIAFDILFTEPSVYGPEDDARLAQAEADSGKVIQTLFVSKNDYDDLTVAFPLENIKNNAGLIGNITSLQDKDDIIRRGRLSYEYEGVDYPSLGIAPLILNDEELRKLPVQKDGSVLLRYQKNTDKYNPYRISTILQSAYAWKNGEEGVYTPEDFEDFYVYVAYYALGLFDICSTPVSKNFPGVGVHITTLDNYLCNSYIRRVPDVFVFLFIFLISLFAAVIVSMAETRHSQSHTVLEFSAGFVAGLILTIGTAYLLFIPGYWFQLVAPLFAFLTTFITTLVLSYTIEGRQKRFIKSAFSQYLSPVVIDQLISNPDLLRLGGERREISIYFSDIQGFTSISEKMQPEKLIEVLNKYLSEMTNIILESGGTIDKYEGDAIIAFWNAPLTEEDHAKRAVLAAMKCQQRLNELRDEFEALCGKKLYHRIGLNTGPAVVGNMGSETRFDYTMLGDNVNLASRLEGLNKQFGTYTMCTQATKDEAEAFGTDLYWRKLAKVAVVGKKEAVVVYEPMDKSVYEAKKQIFDDFQLGLELFYDGNFEQALLVFEKHVSEDGAAEKYAEKCKALIKNPPENWEGVWVATEK